MKKRKDLIENIIYGIFLLLGLVTVGMVLLITVYLIISGIPAIREIGFFDFVDVVAFFFGWLNRSSLGRSAAFGCNSLIIVMFL